MEKGKFIIGCMPLGNMEDMTLRLIRWLAKCDLLVVEQTEYILPLFDEAGISYSNTYIQYNDIDYSGIGSSDDRKKEVIDLVLKYLNSGKNVLMISDEGCPGINDPGFEIMHAVYYNGFDIDVLPGPSVTTTSFIHALSVDSNHNGYGFIFFQSLDSMQDLAGSLANVKDSNNAIVITIQNENFINNNISKTLIEVLGNRSVAICKDLTLSTQNIIKSDLNNMDKFLTEDKNTVVIYSNLF
jgi:16S rRNA (cytidine1402-2'-O)-methyltransferase